KRKEKLEQIEREKTKSESHNFQVGSISDSTIIHGSELRHSPIIHNVNTTPSTKAAKPNWYASPMFKLILWPIIVFLVGTYICHLMGWI
ncbi:MAG TPA: hypothetical protein VK498_00465, partial [Ferruginibacter sp.]|nr:hypothetical protein [Ferruginibacter sp.]